MCSGNFDQFDHFVFLFVMKRVKVLINLQVRFVYRSTPKTLLIFIVFRLISSQSGNLPCYFWNCSSNLVYSDSFFHWINPFVCFQSIASFFDVFCQLFLLSFPFLCMSNSTLFVVIYSNCIMFPDIAAARKLHSRGRIRHGHSRFHPEDASSSQTASRTDRARPSPRERCQFRPLHRLHVPCRLPLRTKQRRTRFSSVAKVAQPGEFRAENLITAEEFSAFLPFFLSLNFPFSNVCLTKIPHASLHVMSWSLRRENFVWPCFVLWFLGPVPNQSEFCLVSLNDFFDLSSLSMQQLFDVCLAWYTIYWPVLGGRSCQHGSVCGRLRFFMFIFIIDALEGSFFGDIVKFDG